MTSLQHQLRLSLSLALALLFAVFWLVSSWSIHHLAEAYVVMRLQHDTDNLKKALYIDAQGRVQYNLDDIDPIFLRAESGHYFVVKRPQGEPLRSPSLADASLYIKSLDGRAQAVYETRGPLSDYVTVYISRWSINNQAVELALAEDHAQIEQAVHRLDALFALLSLMGLAAIWLWLQIILKRAFAGLQPIRQALETAPHQGVPKDIAVPAEIAPLVESLNHTLNQLHQRLARSRQRSGNLAHSLKTPLNLIYQQLDSPDMAASVRDDLRRHAQRLDRLIDHELKQSRLAGGNLHIQTFDIQQDLDDLIQGLGILYQAKKIRYAVDNQLSVGWAIDREDGFELLGNVLDNASKWCRETVLLRLWLSEGEIRIRIEDDGDGVAPSRLSQLKQRGLRLDESQVGHGLGLSIVDEIVHVYNARWQLEASPLGGLRVDLFWPHG
jgi:signal transduction histidine kinase